MSVGVRTPLGKLWHLAESRKKGQTFCGLVFSDGFDVIQDNTATISNDLCINCRSAAARRREKGLSL